MKSLVRHFIPLLALAIPALGVVPSGPPLVEVFEISEGTGLGRLAQDDRGVLFVQAGHDLFEFDGHDWKRIELGPLDSSLTNMVTLGDRLFLFGHNEFGVAQADSVGRWQYQTLVGDFPEGERAFGYVDQVMVHEDTIYFKNLFAVYEWREGRGRRILTSDLVLSTLLIHDGVLHVTHDTAGLLRREGNEFIPVPGLEHFRKDHLPVTGSLDAEGRLVMNTRDRQLLRYDGSQFELLADSSTELHGLERFHKILALHDGRLLGSTSNGLMIFTPDGRPTFLINGENALPATTVADVLLDRSGALWIHQGQYLSRVRLDLPILRFDRRHGLRGETRTIASQGETLYLATRSGLFSGRTGPSGRGLHFEPLLPNLQVVAICESDLGLLLASIDGVMLLREDGRLDDLLDEPLEEVQHMIAHPSEDQAWLLGARGFVYILRLQEDAFTLQTINLGGREMIIELVPDGADGVWLEVGYGAVKHLDLASHRVRGYDRTDGLPEQWVAPVQLGEMIRFRSAGGLFRFDPTTDRFERDLALETKLEAVDGLRGLHRTHPDGRGGLWAIRNGGHMHISLDETGKPQFRDLDPAVSRVPGIRAVYAWGDTAVIGAIDQVYIQHPAIRPWKKAPPQTIIRRIEAGADYETVYAGAGAYPDNVILSHADSDLRIRFTVTEYSRNPPASFRYRLSGYQEHWSPWSTDPSKDYTNLREGKYAFSVQGRCARGTEGSIATFGFEILPPWYRTRLAMAGFGLGGVGLILLTVWWRSAWLRRRLHWLQGEVEKKTAALAASTEELQEANEELAQSNQELISLNQRLEEMNRDKNDFIGIATHDLKNPLNGIMGLATIIAEDAETLSREQIADLARDIESSSRLMAEIITNLLDINRIEQGQLVIERKRCDLGELAESVLHDHLLRAQEKGIMVKLEQPRGEVPVLGQRDLLVQILDNLVSNAVKYSPPGRPVTVRLERTGSECRAVVVDRGLGIAKEEQERLFQKFARLSNRPTGGETSTGLGLAIVKRMVEALGGRVGVESAPGEGSSFWVSFPHADVADSGPWTEDDPKPPILPGSMSAGDRLPPSMRN